MASPGSPTESEGLRVQSRSHLRQVRTRAQQRLSDPFAGQVVAIPRPS